MHLALARMVTALVLFALGYLLLVLIPVSVFAGIPHLIMGGDPLNWLWVWSLFGLGLMLLLLLLDWLAGASFWMHRLVPGARSIPPPSSLQSAYSELRWYQRPGFWVVPSNNIQAYAIPGTWRGAVVVTEAVLSLPKDEQRWLFGHEYAHLRFGDSEGSLAWINALRALNIAAQVPYVLHNAVIVRLPLIGPLLGTILRFYLYLAHQVMHLLRGAYLLIDRAISRAMEYRCDAYGTRFASPQAGQRLLSRLGHPLEPHFGVLASHPPNAKRIQMLNRSRTTESYKQ